MTRDQAGIKFVTADGGLDEITIRSDAVARYLFLNETLLGAFNMVDNSTGERGLGLKETLLSERITDEVAYLEKWQRDLEAELKEQDSTKQLHEVNTPVDRELEWLGQKVEQLRKEFVEPTDAALKQQNNGILKEYEQRFGNVVYEATGSMNPEQDEDEDGEEELEKEEKKATTTSEVVGWTEGASEDGAKPPVVDGDSDAMDVDEPVLAEAVATSSEPAGTQAAEREKLQREKEDDGDDDEGNNKEYEGSVYYRLPEPIKFSKVEYKTGKYGQTM